MDLKYIVRPKRDEDGKPYEAHFLIDLDAQRAWGYVETPPSDQIMYIANPYHGATRWYTALDAAKAYLENVALESEQIECARFTESMRTKRLTPAE